MTLILLGTLVVLGGLAWFLSSKNLSNSGATPTPVPQKYVWQSTGGVDAIDVVSQTEQVSLRKDLSTTVWSIIAPVKETADPLSVGNEADQLKSLQATEIISQVTDLSQYGLNGKVMTATIGFSGASPASHTLAIGKATLDGSGYYTKLTDNNSTVYVVANTIVEPLRTWLTTPPKVQPTPTPIPMTVVPTATVTPTQPTATPTRAAGAAPSTPGAGSVVTGSESITSTAPGAANSTTPVATPLPSPTGP